MHHSTIQKNIVNLQLHSSVFYPHDGINNNRRKVSIMKSYNRNFILMIAGQIISIFGNTILRFSLSLYVLKVTGSASIFATITAIAVIPTILFSPIGGIIADRVNRRTIMLSLDFLTSALIFAFALFNVQSFSIPLIAVLMIALSIIQAFYQPSVSASIPLLVKEEQLMQANSTVTQINALATLMGPIIGGFLFSFLPFFLLLIIAAIAFLGSAILECIMRIPFHPMPTQGSALSIISSDIKESVHFLHYDNPSLISLMVAIAALNMVLSSFLNVGMPVLCNITLQLPATYYGWLEAAFGIGSIAGSLVVSRVMKRFKIQDAWCFLFIAALFLLPLAISLCLQATAYISYVCMLVSCIFIMLFATLFNIYSQTFLQKATPNHLLGKVGALITMISMCANPIGQAIYGILLDIFANHIYILVFICCILSCLIALFSKHSLTSLGNKGKQQNLFAEESISL